MKKFLLAGASTLALLGFAGGANAQTIGVGLDLTPLLGSIEADVGGFGGLYINSAVSNAAVDGSVDISTDGLIPDVLNASRIGLDAEGSAAAALAIANLTVGGLVGLPDAAPIDVGLGAAAAVEIGLDVVGTRISASEEIATTAIGAVNTGTVALAALTTREFTNNSTADTTGANIDFDSAAADSASNTSNTAARAAAAATSLLIEGATSSLVTDIDESTASGPAAIVAVNTAVQNAGVDGSITISGSTVADIAGTATTAIGAVNTGTISNGLPGRIDIVVGGDE